MRTQIEVLRECAATFRRYEALHLAKCTDEGREKAAANAAMAEKCESVLVDMANIIMPHQSTIYALCKLPDGMLQETVHTKFGRTLLASTDLMQVAKLASEVGLDVVSYHAAPARRETPGQSVIFAVRDFTAEELAEFQKVTLKPTQVILQDRERDKRQTVMITWGQKAFGTDETMSVEQRGYRHAEEALEAAQSAGCARDKLHKLVDHICDRPPGALNQEIGGSGITLLMLAAAAGLSADAEEEREMERVLAKPIEHFTARNKAKNEAGFVADSIRDAPCHRRTASQPEAAKP